MSSHTRTQIFIAKSFLSVGCLALLLFNRNAHADSTPGYLEEVMHWGVQKGDSCAEISRIVYGSANHRNLITRYNRVDCNKPLTEGQTLVLPSKVTTLPDAQLKSFVPNVQAKPAGGSWQQATSGMSLYRNHTVSTERTGRAEVWFNDFSRIFMSESSLVVIYGSANHSHTSKVTAPSVELQEGEVKAGIAALRGHSTSAGNSTESTDSQAVPYFFSGLSAMVALAVKGGGWVAGKSEDTVVHRTGEQTTVSVFQGSTEVRSAGRTVIVPANYGTRFYTNRPPEKPRPLPKAPLWKAATLEQVDIFSNGQSVIEAAWEPVKEAKSYRIEVARDATFNQLLTREEVPSKILSYRGEGLPIGTYFVRVRVVDSDNFLGIATAIKQIHLVRFAANNAPARIECNSSVETDSPCVLNAHRYSNVILQGESGLEFSVDSAPYAPNNVSLTLAPLFEQSVGKSIRIRRKGAPEKVLKTIEVKEIPVQLKLIPKANRETQQLDVLVEAHGFENVAKETMQKMTVRLQVDEKQYDSTVTWNDENHGKVTFKLEKPKENIRLFAMDSRGFVLTTLRLRVVEKKKLLVKN